MRGLKIGGKILVFLLFLSTVRAADDIHLTVGDWPPYFSQDLKHQGVMSHIINDVFEEAGYQVTFDSLPWARAYKEAKSGRFDGTGVWLKTQERQDSFYYSIPVLEEQHVFFHLKRYPFEWKSLDELYGMQIGGIIKFSYGEAFDYAAETDKFKIHRVSTDEQAFGMLLKEYITIFPQEINVGYYNIRKLFGPKGAAQITHHPKRLLRESSYLLFPKNLERSQQLTQVFNKGLKRFKKSGKYSKYLARARQGGYKKTVADPIFYLEDEPVYTSSSSKSPGFLMEVVMAMSQVMEIEPEIRFHPWKRAQMNAMETPNAFIFPLTRTKEREDKYHWVCKVFDVPVMFINKQGSKVINSLAQAKRLNDIGVILGTPQEAALAKIDPQKIVTVTAKNLVPMLAKGGVQAIYTARPEAVLAWKQGGYTGKLQYGATLQTLPLWIATSKTSDKADYAAWAAALEAVKRTGEFDRLFQQYFGD